MSPLQQQHSDLATQTERLNLLPESRDYELWYRQGESLASVGNYEGALVSFEAALKIRPESVAAWNFRAAMLIHLERYEDALSSSDRALNLQHGNEEAWLFRGAALQRLGHYQQAYASYYQALDRGRRTRTEFSWFKGIKRLFKG
ncbi:hypothetical protein BST81_19300 [Leptolyngbya sp. 'hensonii']|uniref:tetratricopeptide repeat protein n=1 Tax=Leptolyngbya sp. 'hensonii' TaxID=1922337 RepID=UPI00094FC719|nr:tetratricopeptide repeat protein [Leptolyngbya sp. 'hensonii']OLP16843.1 hypothetical protein BST81_19300 [Leptolyngbya sp. 'hensonii']